MAAGDTTACSAETPPGRGLSAVRARCFGPSERSLGAARHWAWRGSSVSALPLQVAQVPLQRQGLLTSPAFVLTSERRRCRQGPLETGAALGLAQIRGAEAQEPGVARGETDCGQSSNAAEAAARTVRRGSARGMSSRRPSAIDQPNSQCCFGARPVASVYRQLIRGWRLRVSTCQGSQEPDHSLAIQHAILEIHESMPFRVFEILHRDGTLVERLDEPSRLLDRHPGVMDPLMDLQRSDDPFDVMQGAISPWRAPDAEADRSPAHG